MNRDWVVAIGLAAFLTGGCAPSAPNQPDAQPGATLLFAGARLILGDGGVIENGALLFLTPTLPEGIREHHEEGNQILEAQPGATLLFAGARLILGDGGVIENGALLGVPERLRHPPERPRSTWLERRSFRP